MIDLDYEHNLQNEITYLKCVIRTRDETIEELKQKLHEQQEQLKQSKLSSARAIIKLCESR